MKFFSNFRFSQFLCEFEALIQKKWHASFFRAIVTKRSALRACFMRRFLFYDKIVIALPRFILKGEALRGKRM